MSTAEFARAQQPYRALGFRSQPPGALFILTTLIVVAIALELSSRSSDVWQLAFVWLILGITWLVRFGLSISAHGLRQTLGGWRRWLAIPAVFALGLTLMSSGALFDLRRDLSRSALEALAAEFEAGRGVEREWVGLYPTGEFEATANGFRFVVADGFLDRHGYAYARVGEPLLTEANFSPEWTGSRFISLGGGWWYWTEGWD